MSDTTRLTDGQLAEMAAAFHPDSPVQTLVAEVRQLRARVAQLEGHDPLEVFAGNP